MASIDDDVELLGEDTPEQDEEVTEPNSETTTEEEVVDDEPKEDPGPAADRVAYKDIKAKYPTIFKEFPQLRHSFYRDKEFSQIFPTIEEAKESAENSQVYTELTSDILEGNGDKFVDALKDVGDLGTFGQKFFDNLEKNDPTLHFQIISPYLDQVTKAFYREGVQSNDENVRNAAEYLAKFLFGDHGLASSDKKISGIQTAPKNPELEQERKSYSQQRSQEFVNGTLAELGAKLETEIKSGMPAGMSAVTKDLIGQQVLKNVDKILSEDRAHIQFIQSLWKKAKDEGNTAAARSRIHTAYLERAKKVISSERRKLVAEITGQSPKETERLRGVASDNEKRTVGGMGKPGSGTSKVSAKSVDWKKTSDLDFLNDKVSMKKGR